MKRIVEHLPVPSSFTYDLPKYTKVLGVGGYVLGDLDEQQIEPYVAVLRDETVFGNEYTEKLRLAAFYSDEEVDTARYKYIGSQGEFSIFVDIEKTSELIDY